MLKRDELRVMTLAEFDRGVDLKRTVHHYAITPAFVQRNLGTEGNVVLLMACESMRDVGEGTFAPAFIARGTKAVLGLDHAASIQYAWETVRRFVQGVAVDLTTSAGAVDHAPDPYREAKDYWYEPLLVWRARPALYGDADARYQLRLYLGEGIVNHCPFFADQFCFPYEHPQPVFGAVMDWYGYGLDLAGAQPPIQPPSVRFWSLNLDIASVSSLTPTTARVLHLREGRAGIRGDALFRGRFLSGYTIAERTKRR
jgi:hypothetical protein